ncbi:N-acetyltransferase B complex non catalytic subunit-domain-containing protein [Suillus paluster]|uniref:N-acetyltransferase B complex non catalytic subunit-domain-containing protein n=1 Tax=Suillus paluster TaxID=48578 RepID=UPI001B885B4C|nr:N-acetyltransferase B complex non catalytic subunit-domain-containing protein [Suillus paluster]KAG1756688.1 N-acetyltransferase B complex non catalytic subunit-domain-containing protein [Suillus paluster]
MSEAALERQIRPIYDALDHGSNKSAINASNKVLKKYPNNTLVKALKALALTRSQKVEEALVLCDEILAGVVTDDSTLSVMTHVLKGLARNSDMVAMFDNAFKQQPQSEELGAQTFFAHVRTGNWKSCQQVATRMHKQFQEDRYVYWAVIGAILQANELGTPPNIRTLLYKLAHRHVTSCPTPSYTAVDRFHLHMIILQELQLWDEANTLLESDIGKSICSASLVCNETRRDIWRQRGLYKDEGGTDRNWLEFVSVIDAAFAPVQGSDISAEGKSECSENIAKTRVFLSEIAEVDSNDRSASLARLELEKNAFSHGISSDESTLVSLMENYFSQFGDKQCCFEDLRPYVDLGADAKSRWMSFLASRESFLYLQRVINVRKIQRINLTASDYPLDKELSLASKYIEDYMAGLEPVDDLAILVGHAFVSLWTMTKEETYLYNAAVVLEFALTKSRMSFQIRLLLVRIYRLLGASSLALEHYRAINIKQVQNDTLSHFLLTRASTFSLSATGELTYPSECIESSQIYVSNSQDTPDFIIRAFTSEKYSQIPEFVSFDDRLENSLQRDVVKLEHVRMRITHEPINSDLIDMELIELKFVFDRFHHDNRDFGMLPNYQPACQPSLNDQTLMFGNSTGQGWLWYFIKIYIRAFQHASDLDDIVEDKLLIGDRPKKSPEPEVRLPLRERLAIRKPEEAAELTVDELQLMEWATAVGDWLEPYHDHTRPPPAVVLAEANKQNELRTGLPLRGVDLKALNGDANANGHAKKDEEAPPVKEAPQLVAQYFEHMHARFVQLQQSECLPSDLLHVATLTQEAFLLFAVESHRFKTASVVKIHKLGALVQSLKDIRSKASAVLKTMSNDLVKMGEVAGSAERRKSFVEACKPIMEFPKLHHDFVLNIAKNVGESRKKVLEGVGKGMVKICTNYQ